MKKRLSEITGIIPAVEPNAAIVTDNMVSEWGGVPCPQLSVALAMLRFLFFVHQTHHWIAKGDPFYGDHLLFARLYEDIDDEIDKLAEKAIGLGSTANVDLSRQISHIAKLTQGYGMVSTIPQPSDLAQRSLAAEQNFIKCLEFLMQAMEEAGCMTKGLDNLLAGILDVHEGHVYLLKQRCGR
jgi:DNA-binding ferritin-like protein